jgi:hypothetical protein
MENAIGDASKKLGAWSDYLKGTRISYRVMGARSKTVDEKAVIDLWIEQLRGARRANNGNKRISLACAAGSLEILFTQIDIARFAGLSCNIRKFLKYDLKKPD